MHSDGVVGFPGDHIPSVVSLCMRRSIRKKSTKSPVHVDLGRKILDSFVSSSNRLGILQAVIAQPLHASHSQHVSLSTR